MSHATSLIKFTDRTRNGDLNVYWDRVGIDGVPFRGPAVPLMPEEEYQARVVRVADFQFAFFDVADPEMARAFRDVMEACLNGWFKLIDVVRFWQGTTTHYVEWAEFYMQDGTRTPYAHAPNSYSAG